MQYQDILKYYSRKSIQKEIAKISKNREVTAKYNDNFGKRPDIIQYESDILELAKQGATSFHISEEHWSNPLLLQPGMTKKQLDDLRTGWDFILDIDSLDLKYSKIAAFLILESLKFHDVKNISVKFSGNKGLHIGIPFSSFPSEVNKVETRLLFPEGIRIVVSYINQMIYPYLTERLLELHSLNEYSKITNKEESQLLAKDKFNPFSIVDIDTILISNRHLFRSPYSLNEKSGLVSIPIDPENILNFDKSQALPEKVTTDIKFLPESKEQDASQLIIQAFDWYFKQKKPEIKIKETQQAIPKTAIKQEYFPPCIQEILKGLPQDGRKRCLFILINFLKSTGYSYEEITNIINKWNEKNYELLRQGYIQSQLNWHKRQNQIILPPNCSNEDYYKAFSICHADNWCKLIKNPVHYSKRKLRILTENKKK